MKASVSALYASTLRIGQSLGPVLLGLFFVKGSYDAVYAVSVLLALFVFAALACALRTAAHA